MDKPENLRKIRDLRGASEASHGPGHPQPAVSSIWQQRSFEATPDVLVVGAGIVGLSSALFLKRMEPRARVLVLERGAFPEGASVKNAGFACFGSPSELLADIDAEGEDVALARVEARWRGLRTLRRELGDAAIGLRNVGGHELFRHGDALYTRVADRFDALNEALTPILGPQPFQWAPPTRFEHFHNVHAVAHTPLEASIDTGLMMHALLRRCQREGVLVRGGCQVLGLEEEGAAVCVRLADGASLRSSRVLVATNGYTARLLPALNIRPARAQVLLTEPVPGLRVSGCHHLEEGYYYFRDLDGRILLGGGRNLDFEGETTDREGTTEHIQQALEDLLRDVILPGRDVAIALRWSGIMGFGPSKRPFVGRVTPHIHAAVGMGGMGVAIGMELGRQAAGLVWAGDGHGPTTS